MRVLNLILAIFVLFTLAGCPNPTKPEIQTKYVLVEIPETFMAKCDTLTPPDKKEYMAANISAREGLLTEYSLELSLKLKGCSDKVNSIRALHDKQKALYPK